MIRFPILGTNVKIGLKVIFTVILFAAVCCAWYVDRCQLADKLSTTRTALELKNQDFEDRFLAAQVSVEKGKMNHETAVILIYSLLDPHLPVSERADMSLREMSGESSKVTFDTGLDRYKAAEFWCRWYYSYNEQKVAGLNADQ